MWEEHMLIQCVMPHLHMSVWCTDGRKWKTWLLTARLCSSLKGSRTTPSRTGNVRRSSSLWLAARLTKCDGQTNTNFKTVQITSLDTLQLLTWRGRESGDIWFDIRREGWLHILVWRQVWRDVASWGHWRGWIAWHWGVRVVTHRSGRLYRRKLISKSNVLEVTSSWNM